MKKGLSLTLIFEAASANYGEGVGNITSLKKMSRSDGEMYTYISRQAMRYNIVQQMGCDNTPVTIAPGVVQFLPSATIDQYPEIDLFGYMKTRGQAGGGGADVRSAAARLSNAIALEPYRSDLDFLNNMGLARRAGLANNLAQSEIHRSFYSYTVSVDLDRVGEDSNAKISLSGSEKTSRMCALLEAVQFLYRDIKGRRENLAPVFVIGGVYDRKSPYFEGRCSLSRPGQKLDVVRLKAVRESCEDTRNNTVVGYLEGTFANSAEVVSALAPLTVAEAFSHLKDEVKKFYA